MIHVPGLPSSVSSVLVESLDLYPTLSAVAGLGMPPDIDGVDLTPLLRLGHNLPPSSSGPVPPSVPPVHENQSKLGLDLTSDHADLDPSLERLLLQSSGLERLLLQSSGLDVS